MRRYAASAALTVPGAPAPLATEAARRAHFARLAAAGARAGVASHSPSIACTTASDAGELWLDDGAGGSPATYAYSAAYAWSPVLRAWVFTDHRLARASQAA